MHSYNFYLSEIETHISQGIIKKTPEDLYNSRNYFMQLGGKRLRPVLVLMGCSFFRGKYKKAIPAAMAVEYFHNFTLLHDDIMDNAPLRRNKKTVHEKWNISTAILSGDLLLIEAMLQLNKLELTEKNKKNCIDYFFYTATEVCEGQMLDLNFETRKDVTVKEYINMITLKTAVLLGRSLCLGSMVAEAEKNQSQSIYDFGKSIGIAFQLHDDILDVYGTETGKKTGGDIAANKKTFLLIKALQIANAADKKKILSWLNKKEFDEQEKIAAIKNIYEKYNIKTAAENEMKKYVKLAFKAIDSSGAKKENIAKMKTFAEQLMTRKN